jgi:dsRNA-specific ribonuclease
VHGTAWGTAALIAAAKHAELLLIKHNPPQRTIIASNTIVALTPAILLDRASNRAKRVVLRLITTKAITITAA